MDMSQDTSVILKKTLSNIRLQKRDIELEKEGHAVTVYFDAFDVLDGIIGFGRFFSGNKFKDKVFESASTLVQSLATSGNLGGIHLLVPHKSELFTQLRILKNIFEPEIYKRAREFTVKTGFNTDNFDWLEANNNEKLKKQIINSVNGDIAERFFRTVHNLAPWNKRFKEIIDTKRLVIKSTEDDEVIQGFYAAIFRSDYFPKVKSILNLLRPRPDRSKNNLTDAFCIALLIEKTRVIKDSQDDNKLEHPRFFTSADNMLRIFGESDHDRLTSIIDELIHQNKAKPKNLAKIIDYTLQIQEKLSYTIDEMQFNVIQDENYFIYKSISQVNEVDLDKHEKIKLALSRLNQWERENEKFLQISSELKDSKLAQYGDSWRNFVDKRVKELFFKEVWLNPMDRTNSRAFRDLDKAIAATVEAYEEFKFEQLTELNKRNELLIYETEIAVKSEIKDAEIILSLIEKLDKRVSLNRKITDLRKLYSDGDNLNRQFWTYFPVYRYSFTHEAHTETIQLLKQVLNSSSTAKLILQSNFAELLEISAEKFSSKDNYSLALINKLEEITTTFYALQLKDELLYLLDKLSDHLPHFSFLIMLGELYLDKNVMIKNCPRNRNARNIINQLLVLFASREISQDKITSCKLAIGLSLLYYWRWRKDGGESLWTDVNISKRDRSKQEKKENIINEAIRFARKAYDISLNDGKLKAENLYALNLIVFFLTVTNDVDEHHLTELFILGDRLEQFSVKDEFFNIWQFRYNDTLARFYCKLAAYEKNDENKIRWFKKATEFFKLAEDKAPNDETVRKTKRTLGNIENRVMPSRK